METLQTGIITKTVGLKGEIKIKSTTYFAENRYKKGNTVYFSKEGKIFEKFTVKNYREYQGADYLILNELASIEMAEKYVGYSVLIDKNTADLEENLFYFCDLEKCKVYNSDTNELLGDVISVEELPAHLTLIVKSSKTGKNYYIPFIEVFIKDIDINNKKITINVIEGLID